MKNGFDQILGEAFCGLKAADSMPAMLHLEAIKELVFDCEESLKANLILKECVVV